jgi:hypothetical protein
MLEFFNTPNLGDFFHYTIFFMVMWILLLCARGVVFDNKIVALNQTLGMVLVIVTIMLMGLRPANSSYGDTVIYAAGFRHFAAQKELHLISSKEWLFDNLMRLFAKYSSIHTFLTFCATIYVGSLWLALRRIFKEYNFVPLIVIMSMFTFWVYGVNGVRNGMGASLFILAITYTDNIPAMVGIALLGAGIHNSIYLMLVAAALCWIINDSRLYIILWLLSIVISWILGNDIQQWMAGFAESVAEDNKLSDYLVYSHEKMVSDGLVVSTSFRWDFIAFSAMGVAVGAYFLFRRKFDDEYYKWLFNTYLVCNAFWVLIIRAPYSNRFAQISWFILPIVLVYPFMRERFWVNHERMLAVGILIFYAYGFYFNMLPILLN